MIKNSCRDNRELPDIINDDYGIGIEMFDSGKKYVSISEYPRPIYLRITSWRGISSNARHYYGKLFIYEPELEEYDNNNTIVRRCSISGYTPFKPDEAKSFDIEIVRKLTAEDIRLDKKRWDCYWEGDDVNAFDRYEDILKLGKKIFKNRFTGNWKLEIQDRT